MKTNASALALWLAACMLVLTGCFDDFSEPFDGPAQVEFSQVNGRYQTSVFDGTGAIELSANLIAPQFGEPKTINFEVVDSLTTAVPGTHYELPSTSFVIPDSSSFGTIPVTILDGLILPGGSRTLYLRLQGSEDGEVGRARINDGGGLPDPGPSADFELVIVGLAPSVQFQIAGSSAGGFSFDDVTATDDDTLMAVSLVNTGRRAAELDNFALASASFEVIDAPAFPLTLEGGTDLDEPFQIRFVPDVPGNFEATASVDVTPAVPGASTGSQTLSLAGTGTEAAVLDAPADGAFDFGEVAIGATDTLEVTLSNPGSVTTTLGAFALAGAEADVYSVVEGAPTEIAPGASETAQVVFAPTNRTSNLSATLDVTATADTEAGFTTNITVSLVGDGVEASE